MGKREAEAEQRVDSGRKDQLVIAGFEERRE